MISHRLSHTFSSSTRSKGRTYFEQGHVRLVHRDSTTLTLAVKGSERRPYNVYLNFESVAKDEFVEVSCTCPLFRGGDLCKHVWASILHADSIGFAVPGRGILEVECLDMDDEDDDFDDDGDDFESDDTPSAKFQSAAKEILGDLLGALASRNKPSSALPAPTTPANPAVPVWQAALRQIEVSGTRQRTLPGLVNQQLWYGFNIARSFDTQQIAIDLYTRIAGPDGHLSKLRPIDATYQALEATQTGFERDVVQRMVAPPTLYGYGSWDRRGRRSSPPHEVELTLDQAEQYLPRLATTGRLVILPGGRETYKNQSPARWDLAPYRFQLKATRTDDAQAWTISGWMVRLDRAESREVEEILLTNSKLFVTPSLFGQLVDSNDEHWITTLSARPWVIPNDQRGAFLSYLSRISPPPATDFPPEFCRVETIDPVPVLLVNLEVSGNTKNIAASIQFEYAKSRVTPGSGVETVVDPEEGILYQRNRTLERNLLSQAHALKIAGDGYWDGSPQFKLPLLEFPAIAKRLTDAGWVVEANNQKLRTGGQLSLSVTSTKSSDIDWFDLAGKVEFGAGTTTLPKLLQAVRQGERMVRLDDGTMGLLPEEWIKRFGRLADLGDVEAGQVRFRSSQALLLDALLAADDKAVFDKGFGQVRERLRKTHQVKALSQPKGFGTKLRDYQKHGQGWMACLHQLQLGGCLADDMGLGKTVQVLSWLETLRLRNADAADRRPSLVVVPKSLVFNWVSEAEKFAPKLRVLNYTGKERLGLEDLSEVDLVVTTYGTMRLDIEKLREVEFEYLILDEAQAIKNASSQAAKAARLLKGRHRLALSGTPIENHLGELWSLFEFLNPGLLGSSTAFTRVARGAGSDPESLQWLSKAIAPFVLRRTKGQVLTELPEKSEQVIYCEMSPKHKKLYNELRDHFRKSLAQTVSERGMANSKIHVLEALLRLRQAACHPGLLDETAKKEEGAKLEELLERLQEITAEGHKALVFSQFTSFLAILKEHLKKAKIPFLYLDGDTSIKERQARVEQFQSDDKTPLFLISLKAGGSGLNLTSADYVFLLDPWWNPAVENQAIDRTHRIGQTRKVHACRLITKGTVEEKVLELQKQKKNLAEAILSVNGSLLKKLSWEDLQLLLS